MRQRRYRVTRGPSKGVAASLLCILRLIFNDAATPVLRSTVDDGWRHCRQFAMEVFAIAGIDHANFDAHPERSTEYLGTEVNGVLIGAGKHSILYLRWRDFGRQG